MRRAPKLAALAIIVAACGGWIVYSHAWRDSGGRLLPYHDATSQLRGLHPAREAGRVFVDPRELAYYVRFADPGYARPLPRLDFAHQEAVLVTTGPRSSAGYSVRIVSVVEERGRVVVNLRERTPSLRDPGRALVTYPYRLVVFRKIDKPIYIVWQGRP